MTEQWVTQAEAAALEAQAGRPITQPNVSRYLQRWDGLPRRLDARGRIERLEYGAFAAHRARNVRAQDKLHQRQPQAGQGVTHHATPLLAQPAPLPPGDRKRLAEAERAELELAQRKAELLPRAGVLRAIERAGVAFVQGLDQRRRRLAYELVSLDDPREAERRLQAADRELLERLADQLRSVRLAEAEPEEAAERIRN